MVAWVAPFVDGRQQRVHYYHLLGHAPLPVV